MPTRDEIVEAVRKAMVEGEDVIDWFLTEPEQWNLANTAIAAAEKMGVKVPSDER